MDLVPQNSSFDTREMFDYKKFKFKHFEINQNDLVFKVGTDAFVLGAWINTDKAPTQILDVGTGTGVLSLMMAQKYPDAKILAIDSNSNATQLAQLNFEQNDIGRNCRALALDFMNLEPTDNYQLIVSNPPYFLDSFIPKQTILGEAKHLKSSDLILFFQKAAQLLSANGKLNMIFPVDARFETTAEEVGLFPERILHVYGKPDLLKRKCIQFGFERKEPQIESLTIRTSSGAYTEMYKKLTADFHGVSL